MYAALSEAQQAFDESEIPIGAVVVYGNKIIGRGYNQTGKLNDPTAHAEIIAITAASNYLKEKILPDCDIYITCEPCIMCTGAILLARIRSVYFGVFEPKFGACGSLYNLIEDNKYNHKPNVFVGLYEKECGELLKSYFIKKRNQKFPY